MSKAIWGVASFVVGGAALMFASVKTDYDHAADFTKYHTYSWIRVKATDDIWKGRIEQAVDSQFSAKGWSKVESGGDASVAAYGATKQQHQTQTFYDGLGGGGWGYRGFGGLGLGGGGFGTETTTEDNIPISTLTVDLFDTQSKKLIWRGNSSETLSTKPDKNEKKLEKDTAEMFKKFPPNEKG